MTADLTPAQAARLEAIEAAPYAEEALQERIARAIASESVAVTLVTDDEWNFYLRPDEQDDFRRLAVAAIDVMRGAADDGAIGRVLAVTKEMDRWPVARRFAVSIRAAIGAPATADGDDGAEWTASLAICPVCAARDPR